ncbi:hypothetical protein HI13_contig00032-0017 [Edwardsiella piscicida]|nr:hypothetical protein HI13_contig00032-0017 [Edwardsiella piscicida]
MYVVTNWRSRDAVQRVTCRNHSPTVGAQPIFYHYPIGPLCPWGTPMFRHYRFELLMLLLILCAIIAACFYV